MDPVIARKTFRTLEPLHGFVYFSPDAEPEYVAVGLKPGRMGYFASRSAPMGAVAAEVVIATFFNFHPALVRRSIPAAWELASPAAILAARVRGADAGLRALLGPRLDEPGVAEVAELARRAADACRPEGRPLAAGHLALEWPTEPHLVLWHAISILREYRGDGHAVALTDDLAAAPWELIGEEACTRLRAVGRELSRAIVAGGTFTRDPTST